MDFLGFVNIEAISGGEGGHMAKYLNQLQKDANPALFSRSSHASGIPQPSVWGSPRRSVASQGARRHPQAGGNIFCLYTRL